MRKLVLSCIVLIGISNYTYADVSAKINRVYKDPIFGSMVVETYYWTNTDPAVDPPDEIGEVRYDSTTGDDIAIINKAKSDIRVHCKNLNIQLTPNRAFIEQQRGMRLQELKRPIQTIINNTKSLLIGYTNSNYEVIDEFRGKNIKITSDSKNTVANILQ